MTMERMLLQEPYRTGQNHSNTMKYILAGMAVLCNCSDIVQWSYDKHGVEFQQVNQNTRTTVFEPVIKINSLNESYKKVLRSFGDLEAGWDGYDAQPLEAAVYDNAVAVIDLLSESVLGEWKLFPSDNGSVMMVLKKRVVGTVNIGCSTVSYIAKDANGRIIKRDRKKFDAASVAELMSEIVDALK